MTDNITLTSLAKMLDHMLLRPDAVADDLDQHCEQALELGFASVVVNTSWVRLCAKHVQGSSVGICAAVGFPLGQAPGRVKVYEAAIAVEDGATEIEFVINVGMVKGGYLCEAASEIEAVTKAGGKCPVKAVLETCYLSDREKQAVCEMAIQSGAAYVTTSTGMGPGGATLPDLLMLKSLARDQIKVKAAGGIHTLDQALAYLDAGAERVGSCRSLAIMTEAGDVLSR